MKPEQSLGVNIKTQLSSISSIQQAVKSNFPCFYNLTKEDEPTVVSMIKIYLCDFCAVLNITNNLNEYQLEQAAKVIFKKYKDFNIGDIKLFFEWAKEGKYKALYNRLDQLVLIEMMDIYLEQRVEFICDEREQRINQQRQEQEQLLKLIPEDWTKKLMRDLKERENKKKAEVKPVQRQPDVYQIWMNQFDKIFKKQNPIKYKNPIRFIKRFKKLITLEQYFEYKLEQSIRVKQLLKK